jgi:hypothetical protein
MEHNMIDTCHLRLILSTFKDVSSLEDIINLKQLHGHFFFHEVIFNVIRKLFVLGKLYVYTSFMFLFRLNANPPIIKKLVVFVTYMLNSILIY